MSGRSWVSASLIVVGVLLGVAGYMKTRPTAMEGFASGIASFAATVDPSARDRMKAQMAEVQKERMRRGLPYFAGGALAGVVGIGLLAGRERR